MDLHVIIYAGALIIPWHLILMWLFEFGYYLLLIPVLCSLLLLLSLLWLTDTIVSYAIAIILPQFNFSRSNIDKFLDCPIAHRCGTPENSLAGIRWCKQRGAVAVEMDLNLTKDNIPVLFHDNISHLTFEEAKILAKDTISTLHEGLDLCKQLNMKVFLDVKTFLFVTKVTGMIKKLYLEDHSLYDQMVVCSFSPLLIMAVRMIDQKIPVAITHRSYNLTFDLNGKQYVYKHKLFNFAIPYLDRFISWSIHTWFIELFGIPLMLVHKDDISKKYVEKWRRKDVKILAWTVNNKHEQMFCDTLKIPYMTDYPEP